MGGQLAGTGFCELPGTCHPGVSEMDPADPAPGPACSQEKTPALADYWGFTDYVDLGAL